MTRTFVVGEASDAVGDHARLSGRRTSAASRLRAGRRPAEAPYDAACDVFEAAGHPTQRTARRRGSR